MIVNSNSQWTKRPCFREFDSAVSFIFKHTSWSELSLGNPWHSMANNNAGQNGREAMSSKIKGNWGAIAKAWFQGGILHRHEI